MNIMDVQCNFDKISVIIYSEDNKYLTVFDYEYKHSLPEIADFLKMLVDSYDVSGSIYFGGVFGEDIKEGIIKYL